MAIFISPSFYVLIIVYGFIKFMELNNINLKVYKQYFIILNMDIDNRLKNLFTFSYF